MYLQAKVLLTFFVKAFLENHRTDALIGALQPITSSLASKSYVVTVFSFGCSDSTFKNEILRSLGSTAVPVKITDYLKSNLRDIFEFEYSAIVLLGSPEQLESFNFRI